MEADILVLDTIILYQNGCYVRLRRWLKGIHPERGRLSMSRNGLETIEEKDVIKPTRIFNIVD